MKIAKLFSVWAMFPLGLMAQDVIRDYNRSVDLTKYKTFDWVRQEKPPIIRVEESVDPRLSSEALDKQIHSLVEKELEKKGFRQATDKSPDFLVSYVAVGKLDLSSSQRDTHPSPQLSYGHWRPFYNTGNDYRLQRKGTLTIDIVDGATNKLAWRGSATDTFSEAKEAPKKIEKAIKKMFKKFPKSG